MKSNRRIIPLEMYSILLDGEAFRLILTDRSARFVLSRFEMIYIFCCREKLLNEKIILVR